jgi:alkylation response protein AidB-like acyl-CoA dehydrogenase
MPNHTMFAAAITAATLAMAEGAVAHAVAHLRMRPTAEGRPSAGDLSVLGEVTADVAAGRVHFLSDVARMYDRVSGGTRIDLATRVTVRRNQVRASRRAVDAVDRLFAVTGGGGLRSDNPLQRYWRDLHAGMNHIVNVAAPIYDADGRLRFGHPLPATLRNI